MAAIVKRGKCFILSKLFTIMSSFFLGLIEWGGSLPPHLGQKSKITISDFLLYGATGGRLLFSFKSLSKLARKRIL